MTARVIKHVRGGGQTWLDDILCSARSAAEVASATEAITVGVVFGFLPARRAARLDPIEALRSE